MNRTELETFFKKTQESGLPCKMVYYSKGGRCTFYVNNLDANGKPSQKRHAVTGAMLTSKGKPIFEENKEEFISIVPTLSAKANALCFKSVESDSHGVFTAYQKELIAVLEKMAEGSSTVMRESEYKQKKNPEAWAREQEIAELKKNVRTADKAFEDGKKQAQEEVKTEMDKLKEQLAAAERLIEQATGPEVKPHEKGKKQ